MYDALNDVFNLKLSLRVNVDSFKAKGDRRKDIVATALEGMGCRQHDISVIKGFMRENPKARFTF